MTLRQYKLRSGTQEEIAWLQEGRVKVGMVVTLRDSDDLERHWTVVEAYNGVVNDKQLHNQSDSDNWNKHNNI